MAGTCKCAKSARLRTYENMSYFHQSSIFIDFPLVFMYTLKPPNSAMPIVVGKQCFLEIGFEGKSWCVFNNFNASQNKTNERNQAPNRCGPIMVNFELSKMCFPSGLCMFWYRSLDGCCLNCTVRTTTF